jgi:hypothetical protein
MAPDQFISELTRPWAHGEHCDLRAADVNAPLTLDGAALRSFDATEARFAQGLSARRALFRGMAWLHRAEIAGSCDFSGARFRNDLRLDGITCARLNLSGCRFEGVLSLDGARIGELDLSGALCLANLSLGALTVSGHMSLRETEIMGGIWSAGAFIASLSSEGLSVDGRKPATGALVHAAEGDQC